MAAFSAPVEDGWLPFWHPKHEDFSFWDCAIEVWPARSAICFSMSFSSTCSVAFCPTTGLLRDLLLDVRRRALNLLATVPSLGLHESVPPSGRIPSTAKLLAFVLGLVVDRVQLPW